MRWTALILPLLLSLSGCKKIASFEGTPNASHTMGIAIDADNKIPSTHMSAFDDEIGAERGVMDDCEKRVRPQPSCRLAGRCSLRGYSAVAVGAQGGLTWGIGCGYPTPLEANQAALRVCKGYLPWFGADCEIKTSWSQL